MSLVAKLSLPMICLALTEFKYKPEFHTVENILVHAPSRLSGARLPANLPRKLPCTIQPE